MVYYGAVSKACQGCRQRKVKCDLRKPYCLRCEKAKIQCPGYRNLTDILFRDESERIIRRARMLHGEDVTEHQPPSGVALSRSQYTRLHPVLSQPITDVAANFFFTKYYSCDGPPLPDGSFGWLAEAYSEDPPILGLRAVIEAAGMAGISNVQCAPSVASESRKRYGRAIEAIKRSLSDPGEAVADTTLMTVILSGLFEFITFESWDHYQSWAAHIAGATTLLQLRGRRQFDSQRGGQLFMQLRSQTLYACMQHDVPFPPALLQLGHMFDASPMGKRRADSIPAPMGPLCFRVLKLRDAIKRGEIRDGETICEAAAAIDCDLISWAENLPGYATSNVDIDRPPGTFHEGKCHIYTNLWTAQAWNNWRTLRILVNQIILRHEPVGDSQDSAAVSHIRYLSTQICISAPNFSDTSRVVGIIWPLSLVAQEGSNPRNQRRWAVEQLHGINLSMGYRQARLLAEAIAQNMNGGTGYHDD